MWNIRCTLVKLNLSVMMPGKSKREMSLVVLSKRNDWRNLWVMLAITFNLICCIFIRCFMLVIPFKSSVRLQMSDDSQSSHLYYAKMTNMGDDGSGFSQIIVLLATQMRWYNKNIILKWLAQTLLPSPIEINIKQKLEIKGIQLQPYPCCGQFIDWKWPVFATVKPFHLWSSLSHETFY